MKPIEKAIQNGTAKVLTLEIAKTLIGKKIQTKYFGYKGQNGIETFVVGGFKTEMQLAAERRYTCNYWKFKNFAQYWLSYMTPNQIEEKETTIILTKKGGKPTFIRCQSKLNNFYSEPTFTCSDADREVYFVAL